MNLIYDQQERLLEWAAERVAIGRFRDDAKAIGLEKDGKLVAVTVFDCFSPFDVQMHIASDGTKRWMNKALLFASFAYPFVQLGLPRVTGLVPESNEEALAFDQRLGFVVEGRHPHAHGEGKALISLGLYRKDCRFISEEHRK